jgi:hypothetical protein
MGTGAFTQVSANRDMSLKISGDAGALLGISKAQVNGSTSKNAQDYVRFEDDGTIALDFTGTDQGGQGLNQDATTIFDALLDFTNQGTQPINVGEADPDSYPGSFFAEGGFGDDKGDSFDVDDFQNSGQVVSTNIQPGDTLENVGYVISNPEEEFSGNSTFEVTFQATRVGGDRV